MSGHRYSIALCGLICLLVKQTQLPLIPLVWRSGPGGEGVVDSACGTSSLARSCFGSHTQVELGSACCVLMGSGARLGLQPPGLCAGHRAWWCQQKPAHVFADPHFGWGTETLKVPLALLLNRQRLCDDGRTQRWRAPWWCCRLASSATAPATGVLFRQVSPAGSFPPLWACTGPPVGLLPSSSIRPGGSGHLPS